MLKEKFQRLYLITVVLFAVYLIFLVWCILFKLEFSLSHIETTRAYNFIPFHYEDGHNVRFHISEVIENVLIFIPVGIYLGLIFKRRSHWKKAAFIFVFSLVLECSQYALAIGCFDITDLITNTLGGCIGVGIYMTVHTLGRNKQKAEKVAAILVNMLTAMLVCGLSLLLSLN